MNDYSKVLAQAIRYYISEDDILSDAYLREAAVDWVIEHYSDIKDHLRDSIDLDNAFEAALEKLDLNDLW